MVGGRKAQREDYLSAVPVKGRGVFRLLVGRVLTVYSAHCDVLIGERVVRGLLRGRLRIGKNKDVYPGDLVEVEVSGGVHAVMQVLSRRNLLIRPPVANIDQAVVVTAVTWPAIDRVGLDRLLVHLEAQDIGGAVCVNKSDLEDPDAVLVLKEVYSCAGYPVFVTSALEGTGLDSLLGYLAGRVTILAGQSGVGKSRLLTALLGIGLETGELARTGRGRHTTKGVTLYRVKGGGLLADTPGFSKLTGIDCEPHNLAYYYPEMIELAPRCHYPRCLHKSEENCAVRDAVASGAVSKERYETYLSLLEESLERVKRKYE